MLLHIGGYITFVDIFCAASYTYDFTPSAILFGSLRNDHYPSLYCRNIATTETLYSSSTRTEHARAHNCFYGNHGYLKNAHSLIEHHKPVAQLAMDREQDASETGNVLESALIDQRMRADRHRTNFESLKAQHLALQEVCSSYREWEYVWHCEVCMGKHSSEAATCLLSSETSWWSICL